MAEETDPVTNGARDRLLGETSGFLVTMGMGMRIASERARDTQARAIAVCTQINGDLTGSQRDLIANSNYYSAAALGRQVLETTQLIEYFSSHPDRAEFWLTASDEELLRANDFRPYALRAATGASNDVYSRHCLMSGHPRSIAVLLLPGSRWRASTELIDLTPAGYDIQADLRALLLADCLQHIYDAVRATVKVVDVKAFEAMGALEDRSVELTSKLVEDLRNWHTNDPLATVALKSEP